MQQKTGIFSLILFAIVMVLANACKKDNNSTGNNTPTADPLAALNLPATPYEYANINLPNYLQTPNINGQINTPANNTITNWGTTLGRVLFYDKILSVNNTIACASCHKQELAFSDNEKLSKGFAGGLTGRNSMSLINAKFYPNGRFFWDERAATLEIQTLTPVQDHVEMGLTLDTLVARLKSKPHYPVLFKNAFGNDSITSNRVALALSQFVRSIVSYQSKYDTGRAQLAPGVNPGITAFANFSVEENRGKEIFFSPQAACVTCHGTETFTAPKPENNGLESTIIDKGVGGVTNRNGDAGKFKVSSLRNIELTGPYMHDGRFATLDEVIEHYSTGIMDNANLPPQLRTPAGQPKQLNLTTQDKAALVAFLKTLTDKKIIADTRFSNPFK